jgi:hypothetical protein
LTSRSNCLALARPGSLPFKVAEATSFVRRDNPYRNASPLRRWQPLTLLLHPSSSDWPAAATASTEALPQRWQAYLSAWNNFTSLSSQLLEPAGWRNEALDPRRRHWDVALDPALLHGPSKKEPLSEESFARSTEALTLKRYPLIVPRRWEKQVDQGTRGWAGWWQMLRKIRRFHADAEDRAHRFSLRSWPSGDQLLGSAGSPDFPNHTSASCTLCLTDALESHQHVLTECELARWLWEAGCNSELPHPSLLDFACPPVSKAIVRGLCYQVLFLHSITSLARARRFGKVPLAPISLSEREQLAQRLADAWQFPSSATRGL